MAVAGKTGAKRRFIEFLRRRRLRLTGQRQVISDVVFGTSRHFTADELLAWSRRRDRSVSRATVYRTLLVLTQSGLVRELDVGRDCMVYDPNYAHHPNHHHLICQDCQKIIEFESDAFARLEDEVSRQLGFTVVARRLQLTGTCDALRTRGECPNRPKAGRTSQDTPRIAP